MLQAAAVNSPQGPCTFAGGKQVFLAAALVADPAYRPVIEGAAGGGEKIAGQYTGLPSSLSVSLYVTN